MILTHKIFLHWLHSSVYDRDFVFNLHFNFTLECLKSFFTKALIKHVAPFLKKLVIKSF